MKEIKVTEELLVQIANYLAARPFSEVFKLINDIQMSINKSNKQGEE